MQTIHASDFKTILTALSRKDRWSLISTCRRFWYLCNDDEKTATELRGRLCGFKLKDSIRLGLVPNILGPFLNIDPMFLRYNTEELIMTRLIEKPFRRTDVFESPGVVNRIYLTAMAQTTTFSSLPLPLPFDLESYITRTILHARGHFEERRLRIFSNLLKQSIIYFVIGEHDNAEKMLEQLKSDRRFESPLINGDRHFFDDLLRYWSSRPITEMDRLITFIESVLPKDDMVRCTVEPGSNSDDAQKTCVNSRFTDYILAYLYIKRNNYPFSISEKVVIARAILKATHGTMEIIKNCMIAAISNENRNAAMDIINLTALTYGKTDYHTQKVANWYSQMNVTDSAHWYGNRFWIMEETRPVSRSFKISTQTFTDITSACLWFRHSNRIKGKVDKTIKLLSNCEDESECDQVFAIEWMWRVVRSSNFIKLYRKMFSKNYPLCVYMLNFINGRSLERFHVSIDSLYSECIAQHTAQLAHRPADTTELEYMLFKIIKEKINFTDNYVTEEWVVEFFRNFKLYGFRYTRRGRDTFESRFLDAVINGV